MAERSAGGGGSSQGMLSFSFMSGFNLDKGLIGVPPLIAWSRFTKEMKGFGFIWSLSAAFGFSIHQKG